MANYGTVSSERDAGNGCKQPQVHVNGNDSPPSRLSETQPLLRPTNDESKWKAPDGFTWIEIGMDELLRTTYTSNWYDEFELTTQLI